MTTLPLPVARTQPPPPLQPQNLSSSSSSDSSPRRALAENIGAQIDYSAYANALQTVGIIRNQPLVPPDIVIDLSHVSHLQKSPSQEPKVIVDQNPPIESDNSASFEQNSSKMTACVLKVLGSILAAGVIMVSLYLVIFFAH